MSAGLRARRLANEWSLLEKLAARNPAVLEVAGRETKPDAEWFRIKLRRTGGRVKAPEGLVVQDEHEAGFRFPDLFPAVPIEAFLARPIYHPNVHPENGFVCLWSKFSSGDTIVEAVRQLQRVIRWELWNDQADHVMQPDALAYAAQIEGPLPATPLVIPAELLEQRSFRASPSPGFRRRLERIS